MNYCLFSHHFAVWAIRPPYSAAARFSVPRKMLDDRMKGHVKHGTNPGPRTVLTPEQEEALVSYLFFKAYG